MSEKITSTHDVYDLTAPKRHAERLQAARDEVKSAGDWLYRQMMLKAHLAGVVDAMARLIDAKVTLALLERSS